MCRWWINIFPLCRVSIWIAPSFRTLTLCHKECAGIQLWICLIFGGVLLMTVALKKVSLNSSFDDKQCFLLIDFYIFLFVHGHSRRRDIKETTNVPTVLAHSSFYLFCWPHVLKGFAFKVFSGGIACTYTFPRDQTRLSTFHLEDTNLENSQVLKASGSRSTGTRCLQR